LLNDELGVAVSNGAIRIFTESAEIAMSALIALWGCKVPTHLALPGPSAAAACTACRSL